MLDAQWQYSEQQYTHTAVGQHVGKDFIAKTCKFEIKLLIFTAKMVNHSGDGVMAVCV